jgi:hypothetical protein
MRHLDVLRGTAGADEGKHQAWYQPQRSHEALS